MSSKNLGSSNDLTMRFLILRQTLYDYMYNESNEVKNKNGMSESFITKNNIRNTKDELTLNSSLTNQSISPKKQKKKFSHKFIEYYDTCINLFKEFDCEFAMLREEQQRRIVPSFNENETKIISRNIDEISRKMTGSLKKAKEVVKMLKLENPSSSFLATIKENMHQFLVLKLLEFTRDFRLNEERYIQKFNEINFCEGNFFDEKNEYNINSNYNNEEKNEQKFKFEFGEKKIELNKEKNKELDEIIESLEELQEIFKEFSLMLDSQSFLLDRIDENVKVGKENVKKGNAELREKKQSLTDGCVKRVNNTMMIIIIILSLLILAKIVI